MTVIENNISIECSVQSSVPCVVLMRGTADEAPVLRQDTLLWPAASSLSPASAAEDVAEAALPTRGPAPGSSQLSAAQCSPLSWSPDSVKTIQGQQVLGRARTN